MWTNTDKKAIAIAKLWTAVILEAVWIVKLLWGLKK